MWLLWILDLEQLVNAIVHSTDRRHSGMEGQIFADQKLCWTSCIRMGIYSNVDNVTIFAFFPYWNSVVKDLH